MVGLSGSETCCAFSRFEVESLAEVVDDPLVVEGAQGFVTVIIRRPHAYWFLEKIAGLNRQTDTIIATPRGLELPKGGTLPIPGIYFLDADQAVLGEVALAEPGARRKLLELMEDLSTP